MGTHRMKPCETDPKLLELLDKAKAAYEAMTPEKRREMMAAQRRSWVIGEMLIENPDMSREYAESIYDDVARQGEG